MKWNNPQTTPPPHDKEILAVFSEHTRIAQVVIWSPVDESYNIAEVEASMYHGEWEYYFINEHEEEKGMVAWCEVPGFSRDDLAEVRGAK